MRKLDIIGLSLGKKDEEAGDYRTISRKEEWGSWRL
jgi:hypothetical protein